MDRLTGNDAFGLFEAYQAIYASQEEVSEIDEAITSEKGKAKAAEMIAARSTPSGRAKPGQGASVAAIKHISRANVENLGGTPPTPTIAKNPVKSRSYGGTGNKAARRAGLTPTREKPNAWKEELDIFDVVLEFLQAEGYAETLEEAEWMMANVIDEEAIAIITELTGGKGHPGYKAGSRDHGPMQSGHPADTEKRKDKGGTMSQRHGYHLGDMDDDDDDDLESIVKQQSRDSRERTRKPLRAKVKAARKVLSKEEYVDEDAGIISGLVGLALGAKGAYHAAKTKKMKDYPKNFVKGIVDPRTYVPKKKKEQKEAFEAWLDEAMSSYDKARKQAARRAEERNRLRAAGKMRGPMERISLRDKFGDEAGTRMGKAKPPGSAEKY